MWLGIVYLAVVLAAPMVPVEWLIAAHLLVGSGRWAHVAPADLGLPLITFAALTSHVLCRAVLPARFPSGTRRNYRALHCATLLLGVEMVSLLWTPSLPYALDKITRFGLFDIAAAYAVSACIQNGITRLDDVFRALRWSTLGLSVVGLGLAVISGTGADDRLAFGATDPITFGFVAGVGLLLWSLTGGRRAGLSIMRLAAIVICAAALIGCNSKGPVIATAIGFLVVVIRHWRSRRAWAGLVIAGTVGGLIFIAAPAEYTSRFDPALYEQADPHVTESVSLRQRLQADAVREFAEYPMFGVGAGGFNTIQENGWGAPLPSGDATAAYPHSLPLEIAAELGVVGLAVLLLVGVAAGRDVFARTTCSATFALVAASATEALFSGDISDQRFLWFALAFAATRTTQPASATAEPERSLS